MSHATDISVKVEAVLQLTQHMHRKHVVEAAPKKKFGKEAEMEAEQKERSILFGDEVDRGRGMIVVPDTCEGMIVRGGTLSHDTDTCMKDEEEEEDEDEEAEMSVANLKGLQKRLEGVVCLSCLVFFSLSSLAFFSFPLCLPSFLLRVLLLLSQSSSSSDL